MRRWALQLAKGPFGGCPDCGRPTFVRKASLLYADPPGEWTVSSDLLAVLCRGVVQSFRVPKPRPKETLKPGRHFVCVNCQHRSTGLHWLEVVNGGVSGPFCRECLRQASYEYSDERGVRDDLPVYIVSSSKAVLTKARAILLVSPVKKREGVSLRDEDVVLL